ncbi:DUF1415 domain-containing protein [Shewanella sp. OPT22]|nr:DUF1415 domain-containing protein [Shewanella sp. OPT22]
MNQPELICHTARWVKDVIMKYNICPFARPEVEKDTIRYSVIEGSKLTKIVDALISEYQYLDNHDGTETTLVILPNGFNDFNRYLDAVALAEDLIFELGYEGKYQIASFHPEYLFDGEDYDSPTNYTNRSPYPTLHIIREASIERALENYSEPESIPERNMAFAEKKGKSFFTVLLENCKN